MKVVLHSNKAENGVGKGQPGSDRAKNRNERREAEAQEEQPHTPTGNRTGHIHFHLTLSLENSLVRLTRAR